MTYHGHPEGGDVKVEVVGPRSVDVKLGEYSSGTVPKKFSNPLRTPSLSGSSFIRFRLTTVGNSAIQPMNGLEQIVCGSVFIE